MCVNTDTGSIGARIKQIRVSRGITQAELADAIGTTKVTISRYELDKRELRFEQAQKIADFLGVSIFELYGFPSDKKQYFDDERKRVLQMEKVIQYLSEEDPSEEAVKIREIMGLTHDEKGRSEMIAWLQKTHDEQENDLKSAVNIAVMAHKSLVSADPSSRPDKEDSVEGGLRPDSEIKQGNKRVNRLISLFTAYPYGVQTRIIDIVETFVKLNSVGQKHAVGRIKELAELPRYQAQQESYDNA